MKNNLEKVIQRLCYEGYFHHSKISPAKRQISLKDILDAGILEPRILELIPGLLLTDSKIIRNSQRDLKRHPELERVMREIQKDKPVGNFYGIPLKDCQKQTKIIQSLSEHKKLANRSRNLNIRVAAEDLRLLEKIARSLGKSKSETIRSLLYSHR